MKTRKTTKKHAPLSPLEMERAREALGLSKISMAAKMGVGLRTVQHWEQGTRHPPLMAAYLLQRILHEDFDRVPRCHHDFVIKVLQKIDATP